MTGKRSDCLISYSLDMVGDKWTLLIIRDLAFKGSRFYKEFLEAGERIATNVLADRLKKLDDNGIVKSEIYEPQKNKKKYVLTQKGLDLVPIVIELAVWGMKYNSGKTRSKEFIRKAKKDMKKVLNDISGQVQ